MAAAPKRMDPTGAYPNFIRRLLPDYKRRRAAPDPYWAFPRCLSLRCSRFIETASKKVNVRTGCLASCSISMNEVGSIAFAHLFSHHLAGCPDCLLVSRSFVGRFDTYFALVERKVNVRNGWKADFPHGLD